MKGLSYEGIKRGRPKMTWDRWNCLNAEEQRAQLDRSCFTTSDSMVNKYKKKTTQGTWSRDVMQTAINLCRAGESIKGTANKYGLAYATLYRHVKSGNASAQLGRFRPTFTEDQEIELVTYLQDMDAVFFGLTRDEFMSLAFEYAHRNNLRYPESWNKNKKAGEEWLQRFLSRHTNLTLRTPESTSVARLKGFNRREVSHFYENLESAIEKNNIEASRLYNMDETGISTTSNRPPKVISVKGKKQVGMIASAERGQLTTVIGCCNAAGSFLPPFLIFARKKMQARLLDGSPPGTQATCTPNGWTSGEVFLNWIHFFVEQVRPTADKKVLLILDNHESHKYYPALEYATKNNVVILSLAPHTTNKMQPMDVAVYGPLKTHFEREVNIFQKSHPGRIINQYDVSRLLAPAYLKAAVAINAVHGFEKPGIWPVNKHAFGDEHFTPAEVLAGTSTLNSQAGTLAPIESIDLPESAVEALPSIEPQDQPISPSFANATQHSHSFINPIEGETLQTIESVSSLPIASSGEVVALGDFQSQDEVNIYIEDRPCTPIRSETKKESYGNTVPAASPEPGCSKTYYSPSVLRPIPQPARPTTTRKRRLQRSSILTSTPVKEEQKQKFEKGKKPAMKPLDDVSTKTSLKTGNKKTVKSKITDKKAKRSAKENGNQKKIRKFDDVSCIFCGEMYIEEDDQPTENWIQCSICTQWCHEECSAFEGSDDFVCDNCKN
ncbi:unnamed protein product [Acanthoscelides obtectus]|uniref:HTH CENPB-type domain-containing protein n=1 Tax=Acanthoscelides obtectus TaxID=200917 RepID=A0A9P0P897_ACAOB|nr:unnamed protein product [Acanthoscelides obtectus]CAK1625702.1 Jerky protein homolog-like [Acanthoscelides obtectus]